MQVDELWIHISCNSKHNPTYHKQNEIIHPRPTTLTVLRHYVWGSKCSHKSVAIRHSLMLHHISATIYLSTCDSELILLWVLLVAKDTLVLLRTVAVDLTSKAPYKCTYLLVYVTDSSLYNSWSIFWKVVLAKKKSISYVADKILRYKIKTN